MYIYDFGMRINEKYEYDNEIDKNGHIICLSCNGIGYIHSKLFNLKGEFLNYSVNTCGMCYGKGYITWIEDLLK